MNATKKQIKSLGRLQKRSDFLRVQGTGQKWVSKSLILQVGDGPDPAAAARFGLTVSKKTSTSAVVRNRIKRRLRAAAREILPENARVGADFVLIGRADTEIRTYDDIKKDLAWCIRKLGYTCAAS